MASFGLVALTHTCCYSFMHRWWSFGPVALTPLLVLLSVYCCDLRQQQCRNGIADCMTDANRLLGASCCRVAHCYADEQSDEQSDEPPAVGFCGLVRTR